jgi:proteic killer suppression protein
MIRSFADSGTEALYVTGKSRRLPAAVCVAGVRKLDYLNSAVRLDDLRVPPGNRLEALRGSLKGRYSIRINDQYRIVFRFVDGDAYNVRITDYH